MPHLYSSCGGGTREPSLRSELTTGNMEGKGGVTFSGSIQTPVIKSEPSRQLKLESPTRTLRVHAPEGIGIESKTSDISATCLKDFHLQSREGR
ncbi:hypothetical protein AVEN_31795-1, partial [Araneus ventricosus]